MTYFLKALDLLWCAWSLKGADGNQGNQREHRGSRRRLQENKKYGLNINKHHETCLIMAVVSIKYVNCMFALSMFFSKASMDDACKS